MSMILVEVSVLKLDKDRAMAENIAKQIAGCSSEEETGHSDEDVSVKEVDFISSNLFSVRVRELSDSNQIKQLENHGVPRYGNYEIFCPPPEA